MKYYRLIINLGLWHLKPYKLKTHVLQNNYTEYGFLCFKIVIG